NVGPFICKQLIQHFVTSNPTPGYVARVVAAFDGTTYGTARGDLSVVLWAILTDPEARDYPFDPNYGKLRDPVQYALNFLRAFGPVPYDRSWTSDGIINPQTANLSQSVFLPPSVFSYYSPDSTLVLPDSSTILAPEFQILDTATAIRRANFI